jgi:hypothetical protein
MSTAPIQFERIWIDQWRAADGILGQFGLQNKPSTSTNQPPRRSVTGITDDIERMNVLGERAREGNLTPQEAAELDSYLHLGSLLSILQSKARSQVPGLNL